MKKVALILILLLIGNGIYWFLNKQVEPIPTPIVKPKPNGMKEEIGTSTKGRIIESYSYGEGNRHILFVGGMHGGYEWNSVLLANEFMAYFKANPNLVPTTTKITIIPNLNPDGTAKDATGRFNANKVDLNRNFDCKWQPESTWQNKKVSAGTKAFSEPETQALRDFVLKTKPNAVVFWHSKANAVYASECKNGILPVTLNIMNAYAKASGYKAVKSFDAYPVTGDAEGWLASIGIPAITVELKTHEDIEWQQNLAGMKALLEYFK